MGREPAVDIKDVRIKFPNGEVLTAWESYYRDVEQWGQETADYNYEYIKQKAEEGVSTLVLDECDCKGCVMGGPCDEEEIEEDQTPY